MKKHLKSLIFLLGLFVSFNIQAETTLVSLSQSEFVEFQKLPDTVVIDVRTKGEYAAGHIEAAINLPHSDIVSGKLSLDPYIDKNIVFYCHTGVRVGIVKQYLDKNPAFPEENIYHLKGDFRAWKARGKPIFKP